MTHTKSREVKENWAEKRIDWYYILVILPVTIFAFLLAIPLMVWKYASVMADNFEYWVREYEKHKVNN